MTIFLFAVMLTTGLTAFGQTDPDKIKFQNITISSSEGKKQFRTLNNLKPKVNTKITRWYHWYQPHELHVTAGNFSGRLLDGEYRSYFKSGSLQEKGEFKKGVKHGEWMKWYESGALSEVADHKNGQKHGDYCSFDPKGNVIIKGVFKRDIFKGPRQKWWKEVVDVVTFKEYRKKQKQKKVEETN